MLAGGIRNFTGRTNIGYFVWETSKLSMAHKMGLSLVDEIWVPTEFMREMYAKETTKPVHCMGSVVQPPAPKGVRSDFGFKQEDCLFVFTYDSASRQTRKNPLGVVYAFQKAFPGQEKATLVLKTQNAARITGEMEKKLFAELQQAVASDPRIHFIDQTFEADRLAGLIACASAYVSLHRCEGFGYGMAEAMYFGVPVIATGWSGNTDFVKTDTAWPIPSRLIPVGLGEYHYAEEGGHEWAEPDLDAASKAMREVFDNPTAASTRARIGQGKIHDHYSAAAIGKRMAARLAGKD
jgi:glycosyltransferase involved in cell wall biosynthesis